MHAVRMCVCRYVYSMQVYIRVCMYYVFNVYVHVGVPVCMHACTYVCIMYVCNCNMYVCTHIFIILGLCILRSTY